MINSKKTNKIKLILVLQLIVQIVCSILGLSLKLSSDIVPSTFLTVMTKVQTAGNLQNFLRCFTNNLSVLFIIFWLNYWTVGIIGTLWCANSVFVLSSVIKTSLLLNSWIAPCFLILELIASVTTVTMSTYFGISKIYKLDKESEGNKREKSILSAMALIAIITLVAAILETVALSLI